jgi:hypothetical protein
LAVKKKAEEHDPIHCLVYGDPGSKKSTFAATFPTPGLVLSFDPHGKDQPYWRRGVPSKLKKITLSDGGDGPGLTYPCREVTSKTDGRLLWRVEYFHDINPHEPIAYPTLLQRMARIHEEYDYWKTVVFDSTTFFELCARKYQQYHVLPDAKEPRRWYAGSTEAVEEMCLIRLGALPMNVVLICHVDEQRDEVSGSFLRNPAAPGRLSKRLPAGYSELYRAFVDPDEKWFGLQTQSDGKFNAATQIPAPDPCVPNYKNLWR